MAHDLRLGGLGQARGLGAAQPLRDEQQRVDLGDVERGRDERAPPRRALLEDRRRALALLRRRAAVEGAHAATSDAASARSAATAFASTVAKRSMSARVRCSVIATSSPSGYSSYERPSA